MAALGTGAEPPGGPDVEVVPTDCCRCVATGASTPARHVEDGAAALAPGVHVLGDQIALS